MSVVLSNSRTSVGIVCWAIGLRCSLDFGLSVFIRNRAGKSTTLYELISWAGGNRTTLQNLQPTKGEGGTNKGELIEVSLNCPSGVEDEVVVFNRWQQYEVFAPGGKSGARALWKSLYNSIKFDYCVLTSSHPCLLNSVGADVRCISLTGPSFYCLIPKRE